MPAPPRDNERTRAVLSFVQPLLKRYDASSAREPFFLGINGVQGAGKTTLVNGLAETLREAPHSLEVAVLSIDDLYLPHQQQKQLALQHETNPLVQHRGQPGTHDIELGMRLFDDLRNGRQTKLPAYDKSAFSGEGDRVPESKWEALNAKNKKVQLVIFEGWCVGFKSLGEEILHKKWSETRALRHNGPSYDGRLGWNEYESIHFVNEKLKAYDELTDSLHALVHIDAEDTHWVYDWRLEAERELRSKKGSGMTDDQVRTFVDGYYPAYELYTDRLRSGVFEESGKQLRIIVDKDRKVKEIINS